MLGAIFINIREHIGTIKKTLGILKYVVVLTCVAAVSLCAAAGIFTKDMKTVTVSANGKLYEIATRAGTVGEALSGAGIVLSSDNEINYSLDTKLDDVDGIITVSEPVVLQVNLAGSKTDGADKGSHASEDASFDIAEGTPAPDADDGASDEKPAEAPAPEEETVVIKSTKTVTETEELPFETEYVEDSGLYEGDTETVSAGSNGYVTRVYELQLEDGEEVSRKLVSEDREEPQNKVIAVGTKKYVYSSRGLTVDYDQEYTMTATAYAPTPENYGYATSSGNRARDGVVAVDRNVIPLGTKLYVKSNVEGVPDYGYCIAWDTGGGINGMRIDLFMETVAACGEFGSRSVTVYVLEDQSIDVFALRN